MNKLITFFLLLVGLQLYAQEVRCNLTVNTEQISGGSVQLGVLESFETQVREFINQTRWTNDVITESEKIEFSMLINFQEANGSGVYKAQAQVQSVRPVYQSGYNSAVFSYKDDQFEFSFTQADVLNFNIQNSAENNLTAMLAYYVYLVIGYDYETYSPFGGKKYFDLAMNIANQNQNSNYGGWKPLNSDKNRYWIVQNMIQPRYENINKSLYMYHRKGLDKMYENPSGARKNIFEALQLLEKVYEDVPDLVNIQIFFNAKSSEIIGIYKEGSAEEKKSIIKLLDRVYPSNTQNWSKINDR
ncbi:MAG: hypothetical protein ACI85Q_001938 [Salibacteraceae bacterium]|jgi:hypothetical protein